MFFLTRKHFLGHASKFACHQLEVLQQKDQHSADLIIKQKDTIEELTNDLEKIKKPTQEKTIRLSTSRMDGTPGRFSSNDENH
jgi:hypothetical protein